ncbi:uncharacterized protein LOC5519925 [Nematostella vectensis]|uniref:uncharacterized protein LOC5519925 n=1 Tax=Nematostella vectensis TaxID=45351 RepID=UPI00207744FD|nr:uncharacterized protein LOC5519925 [Nematostella vectensis]XP_032220649.2 uncharacterized protein LOC5519925 [Nematostella vectensis]
MSGSSKESRIQEITLDLTGATQNTMSSGADARKSSSDSPEKKGDRTYRTGRISSGKTLNKGDENGETKSCTPLHKNARSYTNVTFPRGFSPEQCHLLASRQRAANYLYYNFTEYGDSITTRLWEPGKSQTHCSNASSKKKRVQRSTSRMRNRASKISSATWKSKEEIEEHLSPSSKTISPWLQQRRKPPDDKKPVLMECIATKRGRLELRSRFPPHPPVYLFNKYISSSPIKAWEHGTKAPVLGRESNQSL